MHLSRYASRRFLRRKLTRSVFFFFPLQLSIIEKLVKKRHNVQNFSKKKRYNVRKCLKKKFYALETFLARV